MIATRSITNFIFKPPRAQQVQLFGQKYPKMAILGIFWGCISKRPGVELWDHQKWILHEILHKYVFFGLACRKKKLLRSLKKSHIYVKFDGGC